MSLGTKALGLAFAALLCSGVSCMYTEPGPDAGMYGEIPGINVDVDGPEQVAHALGRPSSVASGWWRDPNIFDMEFKVWYYRGVGRVIFRYGRTPGELIVYSTEADKYQSADPRTP